MTGEERRSKILELLKNTKKPISGSRLAKDLDVSRQVIVQDIALIRANGNNVFSTNRGYLLNADNVCRRVFKVNHTDEQTEEELNLFVDFGGCVEDVFVFHKLYNIIRAELNLKTRMDVRRYMESLKTGRSTPLKNITGGFHYHTIQAESEEILDDIQEELKKRGFLAKLQDYEPVDFWKQSE